MNKKIVIISLVVILVVFLFLVAFIMYQQKEISGLKQIMMPPAGVGVTGSMGSGRPIFVSGKAEKIENGVLTIQAKDETGKFSGKTYMVKVGDSTNIFSQAILMSSPSQTIPSQIPDKVPIKLSDVKAGDSVVAFSSEAIKDLTSFEATEIILLISPSQK
jgi:hypothetical protein